MRATKPRPGRPKDETKGTAILEAAGGCFLKYGFDGTSMDTIAREAGVSKLTVYSHFRNKDALFKDVIAWKCNQFSPPERFVALAGDEPKRALTRIAAGFMRMMMAPEVLAMHRLVTGEAAKNPKVAQLLYEAGNQPTLAGFAELLGAYHSKGLLEVRDPERAADQFFSMLNGDLHFRVMLGIAKPPSETEIGRHADDCVEVFLRAYARRG